MRNAPSELPATPPRPVAALSIAGSDSGGGAGIQADLRTFAAHGLLGTTAITAITAQNTLGVEAWEAVSVPLIVAQIRAVLSDLPVAAAKTGMLGTSAVIDAVAATLAGLERPVPLVVDPVMVATSGHRLLEPEAEATLARTLLPLATVLTPNLPEAAVLSGLPREAPPEAHARRIGAIAPEAWLVIKGGHGDGDLSIDIAFGPRGERFELALPRVRTLSTHGTGCTLSAAITAGLALGQAPLDAIAHGRAFVQRGLELAVPTGAGHGPLNHLFGFEPSIDAIRSLTTPTR